MTTLSQVSKSLQAAASRNAATGVYSAQAARHRAAAAAEMVREAVKAGIKHERRERAKDHDELGELAAVWHDMAELTQLGPAVAATYSSCSRQLTILLNSERFSRARAIPSGEDHDDRD
jgi:hypothetical protein